MPRIAVNADLAVAVGHDEIRITGDERDIRLRVASIGALVRISRAVGWRRIPTVARLADRVASSTGQPVSLALGSRTLLTRRP